jgi:hypothetical protein
MFVFKQIIGVAGSLAGSYLEKQYGSSREHSRARWQERIHTLDLLLDADPALRAKITRLTTWLFQQNRHEDLKNLQQFLTALDERSKEGPLTGVMEFVSSIMGNPAEEDSHASERFLAYLAQIIGDTGTEADLTEAVRFLEANRIIGFPPDQHKRGGVSTKIAAKLRDMSGSLDHAGAWFQSHTRPRRRQAPSSTPR